MHHVVCRANIADVRYEQDVFKHQAPFLETVGANGINKHLKRYVVLNGTDGWAMYYPARTESIVDCALMMINWRRKLQIDQHGSCH